MTEQVSEDQRLPPSELQMRWHPDGRLAIQGPYGWVVLQCDDRYAVSVLLPILGIHADRVGGPDCADGWHQVFVTDGGLLGMEAMEKGGGR